MSDEELVRLVLSFAGEVNALQRKYAPRLKAERERSRMTAFLEAYRAEAGLIYARYLTRRERTYLHAVVRSAHLRRHGGDDPQYRGAGKGPGRGGDPDQRRLAGLPLQAGVPGGRVANQQLPAAAPHGVPHLPVDLRRFLNWTLFAKWNRLADCPCLREFSVCFKTAGTMP